MVPEFAVASHDRPHFLDGQVGPTRDVQYGAGGAGNAGFPAVEDGLQELEGAVVIAREYELDL